MHDLWCGLWQVHSALVMLFVPISGMASASFMPGGIAILLLLKAITAKIFEKKQAVDNVLLEGTRT